jgi:transcriptional regulator with XRE-family HTH domain
MEERKTKISFRDFLVNELNRIKQKNSNYSLRALSRKVGVSPTSLSLYFQGKRNMADQSKRKICYNLGLSDEQTLQLLFSDQQKKIPKQHELRKLLSESKSIPDTLERPRN